MFKKLKLVLQLLLLQLSARSQFPPFDQLPSSTTSISDLDSVIHEQVRLFFKKANTPGLLIGISENGSRRYYSYGYADIESKKTIGKETIFEIGSLTKTFTANLIAQSAEKGLIDLDQPLSNYIPGVEKNDSVLSKIMLKDILNHTSGLPRLPSDFEKIEGYTLTQPYAKYTREHLYNFLKGIKKTRPKRYEYSNLGFGLLATILEQRSGHSYEQLLKEKIWGPLGMKNSTTTSGHQHTDSATGYLYGKPAPYWEFECMAGAGAIRSNASDMLTYLEAHIHTNVEPFAAAVKKITTPSYPVTDNMQIGYGWHSFEDLRNRVWWHNGGTYGFFTFGAFDPVSKTAIILVSNSSGAYKVLDKLGVDLMILLMGK